MDDDLTGPENLVLLGRLAGLSRRAARTRAAELLAGLGLEKPAARQVKNLSGGMRRRLDLAASLIVPAEVYFLDEPTTGLDPASRAQIHQIVRALAAGGATVLLTTQYLDEADALAAGSWSSTTAGSSPTTPRPGSRRRPAPGHCGSGSSTRRSWPRPGRCSPACWTFRSCPGPTRPC